MLCYAAVCVAVRMQMFGPYAAMKLCELTDSVLLDSLGQLDSCLNRWKELLDPITLAVVVSGCRIDGRRRKRRPLRRVCGAAVRHCQWCSWCLLLYWAGNTFVCRNTG